MELQPDPIFGNMNIIRFYLSSLLILSSVLFALAQTNTTPDNLVKKFEYFQSNTLQEKLYVHIDRTTYLAGELLWFKIYYVDANFNKPLNISKVAYVEILDKNNDAVVQSKVELKNGSGNGSLFIPAVLGNGQYVLRAYTHWMKNFPPEFYFHQPITIINTFVKTDPEAEDKFTKPAFTASFFPEGGHVVSGIRSKIAFRVTDPEGRGIPFKGFILNSSDNIVAEFQPLKFGIGHFDFLAKDDETYTIRIEDYEKNKIDFQFPEIKNSGYVMSVNDKDDHLEIDVKGQAISTPLTFLFAHSKQHIVKVEGKFLSDNKAQFVINKEELGDGVTHFTLFNSELHPVCERLFFKKPKEKLSIQIQAERETYNTRNLVKLRLTGNENSDVSISVYRNDSIPTQTRNNIYEYLWLSSDLAGAVEFPEYYFNNDDSVTTVALDNLMLTHGWRKFNWSSLLNFKPPNEIFPEYRGHIIQGQVLNNKNVPASGVLTSLSSPDKKIQLYGSRSDSNGKVFFEVKDFFGDRLIYVQPMFRYDSNLVFKIDNPFSTNFVPLAFHQLHLNSALKTTILDRSIAMQVHNIYNQEKLTALQEPSSSKTPFFGKPDETYLLDDYTRFPLLEEVIKEYVRGAMVRKRKDGIQFIVQQKINQPISPENPLILLDGVPIFDYDQLLEFSADKIKSLDVLTREYYLGPLALHGAIFLSTYNGDLSGFEIKAGTVSINHEGLQLMREFYSPHYETQTSRESRIPDHRSLLYWNPSVQLKTQNTPIEFYTSDLGGEFKVVVQGLSRDGVAGSAVFSFVVEKQ
jgi:hypothetical protein